MGLTGLGLCGFVLIHMMGNLLILASAESYNKYSHALTSNPLIYIAEIGLVAFFLSHVIIALAVTALNRRSRVAQYAVKPPRDRDATLASKTLIYSGLVVLAFLVLHLITFKYGPHYPAEYHGVEMRDLHKLVLEVFANPLYSIGYVSAMILLYFHLSHSISASLQTLGIWSSRERTVRRISVAFGIVVSGGFILEVVTVALGGVH